jgi:hypothetical protein
MSAISRKSILSAILTDLSCHVLPPFWLTKTVLSLPETHKESPIMALPLNDGLFGN